MPAGKAGKTAKVGAKGEKKGALNVGSTKVSDALSMSGNFMNLEPIASYVTATFRVEHPLQLTNE